MYVNSNCAGCGICIDECNFGAISLVENQAVIDKNICRECGLCADVCPMQAIEHDTGRKNDCDARAEEQAVIASGSTQRTIRGFLQCRNLMDRGAGKGMGKSQGKGRGMGRGKGNGRGLGKGMNRGR